MLPVSPYWILGHDGSLWISFHFRCCCYCLQFRGVFWPIIGMTLTLIKTCPILSCLVPFVRKRWVQSGISSGACLGNLVLSSLSLRHHHLNWPDPTIIFMPSVGGKKKNKQRTDNIPIWHLREARPKDASDQPRVFNTKLELKPGQALSCILNTRECDLLTHAD